MIQGLKDELTKTQANSLDEIKAIKHNNEKR